MNIPAQHLGFAFSLVDGLRHSGTVSPPSGRQTIARRELLTIAFVLSAELSDYVELIIYLVSVRRKMFELMKCDGKARDNRRRTQKRVQRIMTTTFLSHVKSEKQKQIFSLLIKQFLCSCLVKKREDGKKIKANVALKRRQRYEQDGAQQ
jgi:hypothetical protein